MPPKIARFDTGEEPIDGYVLVEFLGRGQFGEVWKARDKASGRLLAVKIIDLTFSPTALKELRAFKLVKNLNHPNLIPIFTARLKNRRDKEVDFDKADGLPKGDLKELVIVMGLGEKSLSQRLKELNPDGAPPEQRNGLPVPELIRYMRGAAKGIDFLNDPDHGLAGGAGDGPIVHCDIKPENMMIVAGEVQIADCGVAVIISPDMRQTRAAGSPAYSAPELSGNKPGRGTDQYALAISYYEMRTGRLPFPEDASLQQIILAHALGDLDFSAPALTDGERDALRRATARVPADRFETCEEFIEELAGVPEVRAAIKAARRPPSQPNFPPRPSDAVNLPGTGRTPIATGSGDLPPGRKSDAPAARPSDPPPQATPTLLPVPPTPAMPRPKADAVDFDVPAPADESPLRPSTPSWKTIDPAAAGPPPQPAAGGPVTFDLPGLPTEAGSASGGPTPWLPIPAPRAVTPPPGLPPGLIATSVVPDIQPIPAPPAAAPGVRETSLPTPATDTPALETPRGASGRLGTSGMPVNPDDPLGKKYAAAEPDTLIREIIKDAQGVKVPPPRAAPSDPRPAARPPQAKKPGPGKKKAAPPPAEQSAEVSKPAWFKQAVAEEARLTADPEKKKSAPVGAVAADPRKSGPKAAARSVAAADWRKADPGTGGGGRGKLIAAIAAGVIGVVGVGAGVVYLGGLLNPSVVKNNVPPPPPTTPDNDLIPGPEFNERAAKDRLDDLIAKKDFAEAEKHAAGVANAPDAWRTQAKLLIQGERDKAEWADLEKRINDLFRRNTEAAAEEARTLIDQLPAKFADRKPGLHEKLRALVTAIRKNEPDQEFTAAWGQIETAGTPGRAALLVKARLTEWRGDADRKKQLATRLVQKYDAESTVRGRGAIADVLHADYTYADLTPEQRRSVAGWKASDLLADLNDDPLKAFQALAVAKDPDVGAAAKAVGGWLGVVSQAAERYGPEWPRGQFATGPADVVRRWHAAATKSAPGALAAFKDLATRETAPAEPAAVAFEYFRLAAGAEPVTMRPVRDAVRGWQDKGLVTAGQAGQINAIFQGRLADRVKVLLAKESPDFQAIAKECEPDEANGWAAAAKAEARVVNRAADADAAARGLGGTTGTPADPDLGAFRKYLIAVADGRKDRVEPAADALVEVYKSPPDVLKTAARRAEAANLLLKAAVKRQVNRDGDFGANPYPSGPSGQTAADRLRIADQLSDLKRGDVALHRYLAAAAQNQVAGLDDVAERAAAVNPRELMSRPDAEAGLTFFKMRAGQGATADRLAAYSGGVRCGLRVLDYTRAAARTDAADKELVERYVGKLAGSLLEPPLGMTDGTIPAGPGREAYCQLVVAKAALRASGFLDVATPKAEYLERLNRVVAALAGATRSDAALADAARRNPDLAEALACRAYLTLLRFVPKDADAYPEGDQEPAWLRMRADAEAAVGSDGAKPLLAHLVLATAGSAEFGQADPLKAPPRLRRNLNKARKGDIMAVAEHFKTACGRTGPMELKNVLFARGRFLFAAANALAKTGRDLSLVNDYLTDAGEAIDAAERMRSVKRYAERYQAGVVAEDRAWLLRDRPRENYTAALRAFADGEKWAATTALAQVVALDVARCTVRAVAYGAIPKEESRGYIEDARRGLRSFPRDAAAFDKAQAWYWAGLLEWADDQPTEAVAQLARVVQLAEDPAKTDPEVMEYAILAHGMRGRIGIAQAGRDGGGAKAVSLVGESVAGLDKLFNERDVMAEFSHYSFIAEYFRGWKAVRDGNPGAAAGHFEKAYTAIRDLDDKYQLLVEQPFPLECLAAELELLGKNNLAAEAGASRVKLLRKLRTRFAWSLTDAQAKRIDEILILTQPK